MSENRVSIIYEARDKVSGFLKKFRSNSKKTESQVVKNNRRINQSFRQTRSSVRSLFMMATRLSLLFGAGFGVRSIIEDRKEFERLEANMRILLGSTEHATVAMRDLQKFTSETPFQIAEVTESWSMLAKFGIAPTMDEYTAMGDVAASVGKDIGALSNAVINATTGQFQTLKQFGIQMRQDGDKLQANFRGTIYEIDNTSEAIKDWIIEMGKGQGVAGSMGEQMETIGGKISNLKDQFMSMNVELGEKFRPQITSIISTLSEFITKIPGMIDWILKYKREIQLFGGMLFSIFAVRRITGFIKGLKEANNVFRMFNRTVHGNKIILIIWGAIQAFLILRRLVDSFRRNWGHIFGMDMEEADALGVYSKHKKNLDDIIEKRKELNQELKEGVINQTQYSMAMSQLQQREYHHNKRVGQLLKQHPDLPETFDKLQGQTTDELTIDDLVRQTQAEMKKAETAIEQEYGISANVNRTAKHITINIGKQIETLNLMPQTLTEGEDDLEERMTQLFRRIIVNMST